MLARRPVELGKDVPSTGRTRPVAMGVADHLDRTDVASLQGISGAQKT